MRSFNELFPAILLAYVADVPCTLTNEQCNELSKYVNDLEMRVGHAEKRITELESARRVCELAAQLDQEAQAGAIAYQTAVDLQTALTEWKKARGEG